MLAMITRADLSILITDRFMSIRPTCACRRILVELVIVGKMGRRSRRLFRSLGNLTGLLPSQTSFLSSQPHQPLPVSTIAAPAARAATEECSSERGGQPP